MTEQTYLEIFLRCIEVILSPNIEGGYVFHPDDPGGETNYGIAKRFYPLLDIKNLTRDQAIAIYFRDYWSKMNLEGIHNENLVLQIFDMGVNAGKRTAINLIQRITDVQVDGIIGLLTTKAINESKGDLVELYKRDRRRYYISLANRKPQMQVFLKGWLNRVDRCQFSQA